VLFLLQLTVIQGDLVQMDVDAVVHPTNSSLSFGGQIGQCVSMLRYSFFFITAFL